MSWAVLSQVMIGFQLSATESLSHRCNGILCRASRQESKILFAYKYPEHLPSTFFMNGLLS